MTCLYASCVEWDHTGILICGGSGSGKSDLALRLIDAGAELVADDRPIVENRDGRLIATCPDLIKGLIEVRGIGIVEQPFIRETTVLLKINLRPAAEIERLPAPETELIENVPVSVFNLDAFESSAVAKVKMMARIVGNKRKTVS